MLDKRTEVGNLDQKAEMLQSLFFQCLRSYHVPLEFMTHVDSLIQSLRNYTFAIQANKESIPDFANWYSPWQEYMKKEPYLHWLNKTRISVVHQDVLTTKSEAVLVLVTDHAETLTTKHYDIMTDSDVLIQDAVLLAEKNPALRHATGTIRRLYYFDVNGENVPAIDILSACLGFIHVLRASLIKYMSDKKVVVGEVPSIKGRFKYPKEDLELTFKLRDGGIFREEVIRIAKEDMLKSQNLAIERYGKFKPTNNINSRSKNEMLRAHFEVAKRIFENDGYHLPMIHARDKEGWSLTTPNFTDRAEKMVFWRNFAKKIKVRGISELIVTVESWTYHDVKRGLKHIQAGKEIKTLRNKGEVLIIHYLNNKGTIKTLTAPIVRNGEEVKLGEPYEENCKVEDFPIFFPVFYEWGLLKKMTTIIASKNADDLSSQQSGT